MPQTYNKNIAICHIFQQPTSHKASAHINSAYVVILRSNNTAVFNP